MRYSAGIITEKGEVFGRAFETKQEAEDYILDLSEKQKLKTARIRDLNTGEEDKIDF